jgi:uroporphyrinogen-III synthase
MKVLITRAKEDAEATAQELARRGHQPVIAPLLQTRFQDGAPVVLDGVQAVLFTSANGVRALIRRTPRRDVPVYAVGPQTTEEAEAAGFTPVHNADGNAHRLAEMVMQEVRPEAGVLLHVHGGAAGLAERLRIHGYAMREEILYAVQPLKLPDDAVALLKSESLDAALFFSPRSAAIFRDAVIQAGLPTGKLIAVCISQATAAALAPLSFAEVRVAPAPNQTALLDLLPDHNP